jgi:hypothetical protein
VPASSATFSETLRAALPELIQKVRHRLNWYFSDHSLHFTRNCTTEAAEQLTFVCPAFKEKENRRAEKRSTLWEGQRG